MCIIRAHCYLLQLDNYIIYICCIFVAGDFNADMSKKSVFGTIFQDFFNEYSLIISDNDFLPIDTYTYVSVAWGSTSWLDQVICTSDAKDCITNMKVYYDFIHSDHYPLMFKIKSDIIPEYANNVETDNATKHKVHWDSVKPNDINLYRESGY